MPWWGWIILGAFLLGAELLGVDAAFYLVFIGFAAIITGVIELSGLQMALWMEWLIFAALSLASMVLFRKRLYQKFRGVDVEYQSGPTGRIVRLPTELAPGDTCRMDFQGTTWTVLNEGPASIGSGERAEIKQIDGTTLIVEAAHNQAGQE